MSLEFRKAAFALLAFACIAAILWLAAGRNETPALFFAYGANLDPGTMGARAGGYLNASAASLEGYRLAFQTNRDSKFGVANIVAEENASVDGAVYWLSGQQARSLDEKSGVPGFYRKITVEVDSGGRMLDATAYLLDGSPVFMPPSKPYVDAAAAGLRHFGYGSKGGDTLVAAAAEAQARKGEAASR